MMQSPLLQQSCIRYLPFSFSPVNPYFPITSFHVPVSVPTCSLKSPIRTVDSVGDTRRRAQARRQRGGIEGIAPLDLFIALTVEIVVILTVPSPIRTSILFD